MVRRNQEKKNTHYTQRHCPPTVTLKQRGWQLERRTWLHSVTL